MPVVIALTVLIQAFFIVHVFRTGRPCWWAFIILSAPVLGCVVYYFVEVFPGSREHRSAHRFAKDLARSVNPTKELNRRLEALETAPTVINKVAAAEEYMQCGGFDQAAALYESALEGIHASDLDLLWVWRARNWSSAPIAKCCGPSAGWKPAMPLATATMHSCSVRARTRGWRRTTRRSPSTRTWCRFSSAWKPATATPPRWVGSATASNRSRPTGRCRAMPAATRCRWRRSSAGSTRPSGRSPDP